MKISTVENLENLNSLVKDWKKDFSKKSIVLLRGELGVGKTEFVKTYCKLMGLHQAASPTFAIHHRYQNENVIVEHLDLYRIKNEDDLESIGFWDLFSQDQGMIFIEWPDRLNVAHLPKDWSLFEIDFNFKENNKREISFRRI